MQLNHREDDFLIKIELKYKLKQIYSYFIPTFLTIVYLVYLFGIYKSNEKLPLMQESENFEGMLETLVTFMSIILSVFGFLIPSFLSSKGESKAIQYFLTYADRKLFSAKLKNVVAIGLIDIFLTCVLFLKDIFSECVTNIVIGIWLWFLFFFMWNSYRFISIMINLLIAEKEEFTKKAANDVSHEELEQINSKIRKI